MKTNRSDDNYLLDTVDNALSVFELLASNPRPMDLKAIAIGLKLPKATAYRLMYTLERRNYVERDLGGRSYRLGIALLKLGAALQDRLQIGTKSVPFLEEAVAECGETANLGILCDGQVVLVSKVQSPHNLRMDSPIGGREPAHSTAMGKALLAALPPDQLPSILGPLERYTLHTITDTTALLSELERVRLHGYAFDMEESYVGLVCVAAPIRDCHGQVIAAMSISGPTARINSTKLEELTQLVLKTAAHISTAVGYPTTPIEKNAKKNHSLRSHSADD